MSGLKENMQGRKLGSGSSKEQGSCHLLELLCAFGHLLPLIWSQIIYFVKIIDIGGGQFSFYSLIKNLTVS